MCLYGTVSWWLGNFRFDQVCVKVVCNRIPCKKFRLKDFFWRKVKDLLWGWWDGPAPKCRINVLAVCLPVDSGEWHWRMVRGFSLRLITELMMTEVTVVVVWCATICHVLIVALLRLLLVLCSRNTRNKAKEKKIKPNVQWVSGKKNFFYWQILCVCVNVCVNTLGVYGGCLGVFIGSNTQMIETKKISQNIFASASNQILWFVFAEWS